MKWNVGTKRLFANHNLTPIGTPIIGESPAPLLKERGSDILKVEANDWGEVENRLVDINGKVRYYLPAFSAGSFGPAIPQSFGSISNFNAWLPDQ